MQRKQGVTLAELIVVMVIIGVVATLGITQYIPARERALGKEAQANIKLIVAAEKIYHMEAGFYYLSACVTPPPPPCSHYDHIININTNLKLSLDTATSRNWDYAVTGNIVTDTFTVWVDRRGEGGYLKCQYSINQDQDDPKVSIEPCP